MPQLTVGLQSMVARPVVDRTGLSGRYDVDLHWALMDDADDSGSIVTDVREQLGLKLDTRKEPFDVTVIDRIRMPKEN